MGRWCLANNSNYCLHYIPARSGATGATWADLDNQPVTLLRYNPQATVADPGFNWSKTIPITPNSTTPCRLNTNSNPTLTVLNPQ